ncbi:MAG: acyltransferase [Lachnospiraceae bacterium]|nr:acyltransferase [Lachnospiraceae bacterium]
MSIMIDEGRENKNDITKKDIVGNAAVGNKAVDRQMFLDILRVAATCAVVLMHTLTGTVDAVDIHQYPLERMVYLVLMDLLTWCVPIFLLISGYLFLNPKRKITFVQMLKKYCRRILLALFLFGVPYAVLELALVERGFRWPMLWQGVLMVLQGKSWSHMWYLYLILLLYLITPALKYILARIPKACIYIFLGVLLFFSSILPFINKLLSLNMPVLPDEGIYFFYYICGHLFASERMKMQIPKKIQIAPPMWAAVMVVLAGMVVSRICGDYSLQMAYNYPFTVLIALLIFGALKSMNSRLGEKHERKWQKAGALCFAIYLVHPVYINIFYKFLHISPLDYAIGISLPLFFAVILLLATITAWFLCKIPVLKKYIL